MGRYELSDFEWKAIEPHLSNKPRGVPRVDDRGVMNGTFWILRSGAPWAELRERYGPRTTVYNRFNRWRKLGVCPNYRGQLFALPHSRSERPLIAAG
jgi:transposase